MACTEHHKKRRASNGRWPTLPKQPRHLQPFAAALTPLAQHGKVPSICDAIRRGSMLPRRPRPPALLPALPDRQQPVDSLQSDMCVTREDAGEGGKAAQADTGHRTSFNSPSGALLRRAPNRGETRVGSRVPRSTGSFRAKFQAQTASKSLLRICQHTSGNHVGQRCQRPQREGSEGHARWQGHR